MTKGEGAAPSGPGAAPAPGRGAAADPEPSPESSVGVVMPALDEEEAVRSAVEALPPNWAERMIVVDNGSRDGTGAAARNAGAQVVDEPRRGYGRACLAGLAHLGGAGSPPEVVLFVDADHRHGPDELRRVVAPILAGEADLVLGNRVEVDRPSQGGRRPWTARWGTAAILVAARLVHGVRFQDLPPVRAVRWSALNRLVMDDPGFGWTLQMQLRAHRLGLALAEVELEHRERTRGRSKISGSLGASVRAGLRMLRVVLTERRWSPPGSPAPPPGRPSGAPPPGGDHTRA